METDYLVGTSTPQACYHIIVQVFVFNQNLGCWRLFMVKVYCSVNEDAINLHFIFFDTFICVLVRISVHRKTMKVFVSGLQ